MAYDERLAQRMRAVLADVPGIQEKRMFGGIGFLLGGNMACGLIGSDIIVRVGNERYEDALGQPGARPFAMSGRRAMSGWVQVGPPGFDSDGDLARWLYTGVEFAGSLPPK